MSRSVNSSSISNCQCSCQTTQIGHVGTLNGAKHYITTITYNDDKEKQLQKEEENKQKNQQFKKQKQSQYQQRTTLQDQGKYRRTSQGNL